MAIQRNSTSKVIKQNVGNDVSKNELQICFHQRLLDKENKIRSRVKASTKFANTLSGFKNFVKWVESKRDKSVEVHITMEPTGVYHEQFLNYLKENSDYILHLVVPSQGKRYAQSLGVRTKTDKVDAKVLRKAIVM